MERRYTYTVRISKTERSEYLVTVPALPGCHTQGSTYEEALGRAEEAIAAFIEALQKLGRPVPIEGALRELHLQVKIPVLA